MPALIIARFTSVSASTRCGARSAAALGGVVRGDTDKLPSDAANARISYARIGLQSQSQFAMVPPAQPFQNHADESGVQSALNQRVFRASYPSYILILFLSLIPPTAFATDSPSHPTVASLKSESRSAAMPFFVGEELRFEVRWMGLLAGNASMAVNGQVTKDGDDVYHIRSLAESSPLFSLFYNVRDRGETFVDVRELYPWYFHLDQREGSRIAQRTVAFDQSRGMATYTKNQESPQEVKVPVGVHDSLSS